MTSRYVNEIARYVGSILRLGNSVKGRKYCSEGGTMLQIHCGEVFSRLILPQPAESYLKLRGTRRP